MCARITDGGAPEPLNGRFIHFFVRRERKNLARGFAAHVGRNGRYGCREHWPANTIAALSFTTGFDFSSRQLAGRYKAIVIIEGTTLPLPFQDAAAFEAELLRDIPHMPKVRF